MVQSDGARRPERKKDVEVAAQWEPHGFQYEWKVDISRVSDDRWQIEPGTVLPFDVSVLDVDAQRTWSWITWGRERNKKQSAGTGDLLLAPSYATAGRIRGQVTTTTQVPYPELILHAEGNETGIAGGTVVTDIEGRFELLAPAGLYTLTPGSGQGIEPFDADLIEVRAGETATADLVIKPASAIVGMATDGEGSPRAQLEVEVFKSGKRVSRVATNPDGLYRIGRLDAGRYLLQPRRGQGVKPFDFGSIEVGEAEEVERDIRALAIPYLARLAIQIPSGSAPRMAELYRQRLSTVLDTLALVASPMRGPAPPDTVFSRVFEMRTRSEMSDGIGRLKGDSTWAAVLGEIAGELGKSQEELSFRFEAFSLPAEAGNQKPAGQGHRETAGPGRATAAGPGTVADLPDGRSTIFGDKDGMPPHELRALAVDGQGRIWSGTSGGGLCLYDGQTFTSFTTADGLGHDWVRCLLEDRSGLLWIGSDGGGLTRYDGDEFHTFTQEDGLAHGVITALLQDGQGNVWIATEGGGVSRYDGERFTNFNTGDGLPRNWIASMLEDRDGTIWFGTEGAGVCSYDGERFTTFTTLDGLAHNWVDALLEDSDGNLWFGTLGGLSRYNGERITTFTVADGLPSNQIATLLQDAQGRIWVGTHKDGAARFDGQSFRPVPSEILGDDSVTAMVMDDDQRLWIATERGLAATD